MRSFLIGASVSAAALVALGSGCGPALAQGDDMQFAGTIGAGWTDYLTSGDVHTNDWLASGAAVLTLDNPGFDVQANFNNSDLQVPGKSSDLWSYGGDVYWRDYAGNIGINANFESAVTNGTGVLGNTTIAEDTYGWFGQWFARPNLTFEIKGGRFEGHFEGLYGDVGAVFYPYHDIALSLTSDYAEAEHVREQLRDAMFTAVYLPVHDVPVSVYLGYDYSLVSALPHQQVSALMVGLKAYLGGGGRNGTLVDYQRNGTTNWDGAPAGLVELGF
jgi:hypothetical protein